MKHKQWSASLSSTTWIKQCPIPSDLPAPEKRIGGLQCKRCVSAWQDAEECIRLEPTFIKGYTRKGHLEFFMKDYEKALETYEARGAAIAVTLHSTDDHVESLSFPNRDIHCIVR
jgi:hypothetical protein